MKSRISLEGMRFQAFHGVMPQERSLGNVFLVDVYLEADIDKAVLNDSLKDTIDYAAAYEIIKEEMQKPSKLLEHVAGRILFGLFGALPPLERATVRVSKLNTPLGQDVERSAVEVTMNRDEWITFILKHLSD